MISLVVCWARAVGEDPGCSGGVFSPSLVVLSDQAELGWRHLLVARGEEKNELIQGGDTRWEKVVGCFMLPLKRAHLDLPYLARESELTTLDLPAERKVPYHRCDNPDFNQFVGAEDPRLFFTDDGQPLMVYSQTGRSPNICRALYIIDARVVIPGLDKALMKKPGGTPQSSSASRPMRRLLVVLHRLSIRIDTLAIWQTQA